MKRYYITDLREGSRVEEVYRVVSKSVQVARNNSQYLRLRLADKTGEIDAFKWQISDGEIDVFNESDYLLISATVKSYNDKKQLTVETVERYLEPIDPSDFIACSVFDPSVMMNEINGFILKVTDPNLSELLRSIFADSRFAAGFSQAPAAMSHHHNYISGLLEHTLNVARTCRALADLYPNVNRDLLIAGALLHDIGKVEEYEWNGNIKFTASGNFLGHLVIGSMMVKEAADKIAGFDPIMNLAIQHMILSHHGNPDWGSPKKPACVEAYLLHHADDMDAKVAAYTRAVDEAANLNESELFTSREPSLDVHVFRGFSAPRSAETKTGEQELLDVFAVESHDPFADQ